VPAGQFGLKQVIEIGPMSGKSNVTYWLESRGLEVSEDRVTRIYECAKQASAVLSEEEVMALL
jgi:2-isopropylmalate synthase